MKTLELTGPALNYAVAVALGHEVAIAEGTGLVVIRRQNVVDYFDPAANWGWAGPLLDAADIDIRVASEVPRLYRADLARAIACPTGGIWRARAYGPTRLTAGLRCLVRSKLGDEVDIPKEITC
jgi:hypothetical protein